MDPLSISASIIALCGAVASVSKGLRYAAAVRKAPVEFLELQNQLQTLQGYLIQLRTALDAIESPNSSLPPPDLVHVGMIVQGLEEDIKSLEEVTYGFETLAKGRVNSKGQPRIPRLKWQRELATICSFREKIVQKRSEIADCLQLLLPSQNLAQATLMLDIKALTETRFDDLSLLLTESTQKMHSSLIVLEERLEGGLPEATGVRGFVNNKRQADIVRSQLLQCVDGIKGMVQTMERRNDEVRPNSEEEVSTEVQVAADSLERIMSALDTACHRLDEQDQAQGNGQALEDIQRLLETSKLYAAGSYEALRRSILARDFRKTTSVDQYKSISPVHPGTPSASPIPLTQQQRFLAAPEGHLDGLDGTTESGTWHVQAAVRMRCPTTCKCQCHAVTTSRTPSMLSRVLGTIIFSYNSIAVWDSRPCNHPKCLKNSSNSVYLNYLFPAWLPRLAMAFSISWDRVVGSGASLYVSLPRVISGSSEVFKAIDTNNVPRLQHLFSARMFFPTDINEDGVCLLTYALYVIKSWPAAKLLLDMHPRVVHRDNHGNAPVSIASWKFYVHGHYLEPDVNGLYKRIMALGDEESHSTLIHDSVIARTKITVEDALDLEPQSLDAMDNFGMTALQWAVLRNNAHATRTILSWNPKLELCDYDGRTVLHRAAEFGLLDCAGMLLAAGANVDARDAWGDTPLHLATTLPDTNMLALLLGEGAAAVMPNRYGRTAIHGSAFGRFPDDETVLHHAVELLQTAGARIGARDLDGMTPLVVAVQQSHVAMFHTLRSHGAVIDGLEVCVKQRTVFHIAAMFSTRDMIRTLHDEHMALTDPDAKDETGLTATDYFTARATLPQSDLSEGQQHAAGDEIGPFAALMSEARVRYQNRARKIQRGQRISDESIMGPHSISATCSAVKTESADSDEDEYYDAVELL